MSRKREFIVWVFYYRGGNNWWSFKSLRKAIRFAKKLLKGENVKSVGINIHKD